MKTIKKLKLVTSIVFLLSSNFIFSQGSLDVGFINYSVIPKSDFEKNGGTAAYNNLELNFVTPTIKFSEKASINNVLNYRMSSYEYNDFLSSTENLPENLQEIRYSILFRQKLNSNWNLLAIPRISIRGDFETSVNNDYLFPAFTAFFIKTSIKNPNFKWGFGVNYNNDLRRNNLLPALTFQYNSEKMRVIAFLPNNASITFLPTNKKIEYGFGFNADGGIYSINNFKVNNQDIEYLRTLNIFVNPTFSYNIASTLWVNLKAGMVLARNYSLYDNNVESPSTDFENTLDASPFAQIGISFRSKK